jgi:hypothetical protein
VPHSRLGGASLSCGFHVAVSTVNELLDNWSVLTAKNVTFPDATKAVRKLLSQITLERCFDRKLWPQFKFFALVRPDNDIFPVRAVYNGTTQNIGINYLTSKEPIWFAGPDIIASILLTGKVPYIEKAIRVNAHGKQQGLTSTSLRGMVKVDANKHSFFKHVIEQRAAYESNPALHYWLKILANSGSYGLFVELNPNEADAAKLKVFSGEESFETTSDVVEEPGKWFAPHIGSLITSGGRLLLGMLEKCITGAGGTFLFCDTDSAAIVSTAHRQRIAMPNGANPITALSRAEVQRIVDRFDSLNPYDLDGSILKIHKLNWDSKKQRRQLYGYALTHEYDGRRALVKNFFMLLDSYENHPETKSLGPDGKPCEFDTRGLLQRAHIVANWPPVYIGKESDKHWEEGEDLSLLDFKTIEYKRKGTAVATDEQLTRIAKVPRRELMRRGINQHTLEKICRGESVRGSKLAKVLKVHQEWEFGTGW